MAAYNNVTVIGDSWVDLHTLSGAPVGQAIKLQNIGTACVRLHESNTLPLNNNGGVLFTADYGDLSKATVSSGSLRVWVMLTDSSKPTTIAVFD